MIMNEQRKGELALASLKTTLRQNLSLRDIANTRREIGNTVKDPEMVAVKATPEELLTLFKGLAEEIFKEQMKPL